MDKKWVQYVATFICIAIVATCIYISPSVIRPLSYAELMADEPPIFTGVINIWQVSSWRVAQSSKTLCMLDVAKKFEQNNPFVYVEVVNISLEQYEKNIAKGIYPDILAFPAEMKVELDKCTTLPAYDHLLPIHQSTYLATGSKVIPWLATSNICIINSKKADRMTLDINRHQSAIQIATNINTLAKNDTYNIGSVYATIPLAISNATIEPAPTDHTPYSAWISFMSKETDFIYGCIWQTYSMDRLIDKGKGFDAEYIYPTVDMPRFLWTQNVCVFNQNPNKNIMINEYLDMLLSDKYQVKIADSTASFPTTNVSLDYQGVRRDILSNAQQQQLVIIPGIGVSSDEISSALTNEINAKSSLLYKLIIQ